MWFLDGVPVDSASAILCTNVHSYWTLTIGVEDDGYPRGLTPQELEVSHNTLKAMALAVNATIQPLKEMTACKGRLYVIFRISRICLDHLSYTDLRIAGGHSSGSSKLQQALISVFGSSRAINSYLLHR